MRGNKVGIGVIGLDHWYQAYGLLYSLQYREDAYLAAVADDVDPARGQKMASLYEAGNFYAEYRQLLDSKDVDAVVVLTTTDRHEALGIASLEAGKPVMVGKPIAPSLAAADRMIAASARTGVPLLAMASAPTHNPIDDLVRQGVVGEPYAAYYTYWATMPQKEHGDPDPGWFVDPRYCCGGSFIDHAVYGAGLVRSYLRDEAVRVYAEMGKYVQHQIPGEDHGIAFVRFSRGGFAVLEATFTEQVARHNRVMVVGTDGQVEIHQGKIRIQSKSGAHAGQYWLDVPPPTFAGPAYEHLGPFPPDGYNGFNYVKDLVDWVVARKPPRQTAEGARANLEMCLAAYQSMAETRPVSLPLTADVDVWKLLGDRLPQFTASRS